MGQVEYIRRYLPSAGRGAKGAAAVSRRAQIPEGFGFHLAGRTDMGWKAGGAALAEAENKTVRTHYHNIPRSAVHGCAGARQVASSAATEF